MRQRWRPASAERRQRWCLAHVLGNREYPHAPLQLLSVPCGRGTALNDPRPCALCQTTLLLTAQPQRAEKLARNCIHAPVGSRMRNHARSKARPICDAESNGPWQRRRTWRSPHEIGAQHVTPRGKTGEDAASARTGSTPAPAGTRDAILRLAGACPVPESPSAPPSSRPSMALHAALGSARRIRAGTAKLEDAGQRIAASSHGGPASMSLRKSRASSSTAYLRRPAGGRGA